MNSLVFPKWESLSLPCKEAMNFCFAKVCSVRLACHQPTSELLPPSCVPLGRHPGRFWLEAGARRCVPTSHRHHAALSECRLWHSALGHDPRGSHLCLPGFPVSSQQRSSHDCCFGRCNPFLFLTFREMMVILSTRTSLGLYSSVKLKLWIYIV